MRRLLDDAHLRQLVAAFLRLVQRTVPRVAVGGGAEELGESSPRVVGREPGLGEDDHAVELLAEHRVEERLLRREAAEHGAVTDARAASDLVDAHVDPALGEALLCSAEDEVEIALGVGPHAATGAAWLASASIRATSRLRSSESMTTSPARTKIAAPANA